MPIFSRDQLYVRGVPVTRSLFSDVQESPYNILRLGGGEEAEDGELPLLRDYYREYTEHDVTEYTFSMEVFGSWDFWKALAASTFVKPQVAKWREESMMRQKSKAVLGIALEATNGKNPFAAQKWLYDNGFVTNKPVKNARKAAAPKVRDEVKEDMERLGLTVIKGES